ADVRYVALRPVGDEQCQTIENELAKTGIIFGEVIDLRLLALFWRADLFGLAVQVARTPDFETKLRTRVTRVEVFIQSDNAELVGRKIAGLVHSDTKTSLSLGIFAAFDP